MKDPNCPDDAEKEIQLKLHIDLWLEAPNADVN